MELTNTHHNIQQDIHKMMKREIDGGEKTGFSPYMKDLQIMFYHRWLLLIGIKK